MVGMGVTDHHHIKIAVEENALAVSPRLKWGGTTTKKNVNEKNRCNYITLITIVYAKCCNKI